MANEHMAETTNESGATKGNPFLKKFWKAAPIGLAALILVVGLSGGLAGLGMPAPAQASLTILLIATVLWVTEALPLFVTSFIVLFLSVVWLPPSLAATEHPASASTFLAPFFSDIVLLFLGGFTLSAALHRYHLDRRMAQWLIRRTGTSVPRLMAGVMLGTAFLSMWLSNTATSAMMLALVFPVLEGLPPGTSARKALILCVPIAANIGGIGTPIGTPPNAIALQYLQKIGHAPSFVQWITIGVPMVVILLVLAWGLLLVVFKAKGSLEIKTDMEKQDKYDRGMIIVLVGSAVTALGWVTSEWHGLSAGTVALIPIILFFGARMLDLRDFKNLSWDVLIVMGGGLCLGAVISVSGLAGWIVDQLPVQGASLYAIMIVFAIAATTMSCLMSHTATANLIMPIVLGLSITPLTPVLLAVAFSCSTAMALPISTPPNAMAFSFGELTVADMMKAGLVMTLAGIILTLTAGYWWWQIVGLF